MVGANQVSLTLRFFIRKLKSLLQKLNKIKNFRLDKIQRLRCLSNVPPEVLPPRNPCLNCKSVFHFFFNARFKNFNIQRGDIGECRLGHNLAYRSDYERARAKDPRLFFEFDVSTRYQ